MSLALTSARFHSSTHWSTFLEGVVELGKLSFALAHAGDAEYMWVPDNRKALGFGPLSLTTVSPKLYT